MIDNRQSHQTPEGIVLSFASAGIVLRAFAKLIDGVICVVALVVSAIFLDFLEESGMGILMLLSFFVVWLYPVFCEVLWNGQTLGKKACGLYVCMDNGMPIFWQASMVRNLLAFADFLPFGFFAGSISCLFSKNNKRLGDIFAGTMVVYVDKPIHRAALSPYPPKIPPIALTATEQQAVLAFAERQATLSRARKQELAQILSPITDGVADDIVGYAHAIMGASTKQKPPKHHHE